MKKLLYIPFIFILFACSNENAFDCIQTAGKIVQREIAVGDFDRVLVNEHIEMIISSGTENRVVVETGENLINDVKAVVQSGRLILTDNNDCNWVRDYGITKIYVTAIDITEIRSGTQFPIRSEGVLTFPQLTILSETFEAPDTAAVGEFFLEIDNENLTVVFNNLSNMFISGNVDDLDLSFAAGNPRFEGAELIARNVNVFHRSSNDIIIHPTETLTGRIVSTGDVIAVNQPPVVDVEVLYQGRLIFRN
ncbi:head GIN domain-containing protein [Sungkyunkwania multivorans]|uniref:Head GIN domain-containing protein n=1 Tax=Sungkyunkwania multivorans TaxID=1173618 RepID=A0ABW3D119_9FLAO